MNSNGDKSSRLGEVKALSLVGGTAVYGHLTDDQTRCVHYHSSLDVIAIKFKCCGRYYPCFSCHEEVAGHAAEQWDKKEFATKAILCGMCGIELTIDDYINSGNECPKCKARFNPACALHYHLYFHI